MHKRDVIIAVMFLIGLTAFFLGGGALIDQGSHAGLIAAICGVGCMALAIRVQNETYDRKEHERDYH